MKKFKSLLSVFMALTFAMMCIGINASLSVSADDEINIIVQPNANDTAAHTYAAYQIFKGDIDAGGTKLSNIEWGSGVNGTALLAALKASPAVVETTPSTVTLAAKFASCTTAADVAKVLDNTGDYGILAKEFAKVVNGNLTSVFFSHDDPVTYSETATINVNVTNGGPGYYLVKDSSIDSDAYGAYTELILCLRGTTTVNTETLSSKSEVPTLEKKVKDGSNYADANTAGIGDTITYKLTSVIPNSIKTRGYDSYSFVITDTLSKGLTFKEITSAKATYGSTENDLKSLNKCTETHSTNATTGVTTLTITVDGATLLSYINALGESTDDITVTIIYTATLNENAVISSGAATADGNDNEAILTYSNDPNSSSTGTTPPEITTTYTTGIVIYKYYNDGSSDLPLTGAAFELTGDKLNQVYIRGNTYTTDTLRNTKATPTAEKAEDYVIAAEGSTDLGKLFISGLGEGTYTISEIVTPDGFNSIDDKTLVIEKSISGGKCTWTYTIDGTATTSNSNQISILNQGGIVLPATGGIGTTIFYIAGGSIMILAGLLFVTKKIVDSKEKKNR